MGGAYSHNFFFFISGTMESQKATYINPVIMDIHNSIMDIHNQIMDIHNSIRDISIIQLGISMIN